MPSVNFLRYIIWIHSCIYGNQCFCIFFFIHHSQVSHPLVAYPRSIHMLAAGSNKKHNSGTTQCRINNRFIILSQPVFQCYPWKKDFISFLRKSWINILSNYTVFCTLAASFFQLFITDKNIKGLFLLNKLENLFLKLCYFCCFILMLLSGHWFCFLARQLIVRIFKNWFWNSTVTCRNHFFSSWIFYILNSIST